MDLGDYDSETKTYFWRDGHCSSSTTSCTFAANKVNAGTYYVQVRTCDGSVCSGEVQAADQVKVWYLQPPSLSGTTTTYTGAVSLSWSAPTNATSYQLYAQYYSKSSSSWSSYALKYSGASRSWSQSLTSDQKYAHYYVKACDGGCAGASNTVTTTYSAPTAPGLSGPTQTTDGSISLSWSAPTGATSYRLYGSYQSRAYGTWTSPTVIYSGSARSYTDTVGTMKSNASYYVQACNVMGCGSNSNTVNVAYSLTGGGGGGCGASCGGCGKVLCFVMPDPDRVALTRRPDLQTVPPVHAVAVSRFAPLRDSALERAVVPTRIALNTVEPQAAVPLQPFDFNSGYDVTVFAALPELSRPSRTPSDTADRNTLLALQQARQKRVDHTLHQASEQAMQAAATRRAEARFAALEPPVPAADRAAWAKWQQAEERAYPNGPHFAPPAYLAYADARIKPAATTPYRFTVQYVYDDASGGLAMVANADTGFIYWQADMDDNEAPVDAWGHVLVTTDGNSVSTVTTYDAATGSPTGISAGIEQATNVQSLVYSWDGFGNLIQRQDANQTLSEGFQYDGLNRLTQSTVTNPAGTGATLSMSYDALGNITCKSDVVGHACSPGSTDYTYDPAHPHAVQSVAGLPGTFSYDADGNMQSGGNISKVVWSVDNLPTEIDSSSGASSDFAYGPDHQRYLQTQSDGTVTTYVGGLYEVVSSNSGATIEYRHNIVADGQVVAVHTLDQSGNAKTSYLHYDHLGSVDAITDDTGAVTQRMSFDAFGQRRDPSNWTNDLTAGDIASLKNTTDRGFTDQEQLDNVGLVHMNGRVYDPQIGRFISADPTVPDPMYSQAFNRYSYVYNSPLEYVDPSGFDPCSMSNPGIESQCSLPTVCVPKCPTGKNPGADGQNKKNTNTNTNTNSDPGCASYGCDSSDHGNNGVQNGMNDTNGVNTASYDVVCAALCNSGGITTKSDGGAHGGRGLPPGWNSNGVPTEGANHICVICFIFPELKLVEQAADAIAESEALVNNPIPKTLARVVPGEGPYQTLAPPGSPDAFVTDASTIQGMNPDQISQTLTIPENDTFTIIEFPTPESGIASPISRVNPGFVGFGQTAGGAPEFVIPNGPIPVGATVKVVGGGP